VIPVTTYDRITDRSDTAALIPEEVSREMLGKATESSAVLRLFRHIPVQRAQVRFPILSALPVAYWVSGDTGLKQTTDMAWTNKYMNIEEIAAIFPVPDSVAADVEVNIWDEAVPLLTEQFGRVLDEAVFFGTNAPASFPDDLVTAATAAGNKYLQQNANTAGGFWGDIDNLHEMVEDDGFSITGWVGNLGVKSKLRKARNADGDRLSDYAGRTNGALTEIDGFPVDFAMKGAWSSAAEAPQLIGGDFSEFVVGVRQDISLKVLTEAVIQDNNGAIIYNLAQQDMTALRLTFRVGWQVSNRINNQKPTEAQRYPVAVLGHAAAH
jgi:HK97 family phage major capsid protein